MGKRTTWIVTMGVSLGLVLAPALAQALDPAPKCESGKLKGVGKYASCRLKAESVAVKKGISPDYSKCVAKFSGKWTKLETKGAGQCPTNGDYTDVDVRAAGFSSEMAGCLSGGACITCADDLAACLQGCPTSPAALLRTGQLTSYGAGDDGALQYGIARSYTDNGDGTITDNSTGLMWEKKSDDGSIHDRGNLYTWGMASSSYTMNGTMVTDFLNTLNTSPCFAGYCDWRIPNRRELESIVDLENVDPAVNPVFNTGCTPGCTVTTCSCTASYYYWSSSTYADSPGNAWLVDFGAGHVHAGAKGYATSVRAVRGGS